MFLFFFLLIFFLFNSRCFCICYCSFLMAFTSLSQALDLDPKEMSCQNFFLHVALYLLCSVWPEVFFFSAYFDTLDLRFLCAINLLHPSCNGNGAVLGAVLGSSVARGWTAQQGLVLPGPGVVPPVPAALGHCKQAASSCHSPLRRFCCCK